MDPLSYFLFQSVLHDWYNKDHGMSYPVWDIGKSSPCGGSKFPLSLSKLSFTICLKPYYRKLLNKIFSSTVLIHMCSGHHDISLLFKSQKAVYKQVFPHTIFKFIAFSVN